MVQYKHSSVIVWPPRKLAIRSSTVRLSLMNPSSFMKDSFYILKCQQKFVDCSFWTLAKISLFNRCSNLEGFLVGRLLLGEMWVLLMCCRCRNLIISNIWSITFTLFEPDCMIPCVILIRNKESNSFILAVLWWLPYCLIHEDESGPIQLTSWNVWFVDMDEILVDRKDR
jgi:hypothetical protein